MVLPLRDFGLVRRTPGLLVAFSVVSLICGAVAKAETAPPPKRLGILSALSCPTPDKPAFWGPMLHSLASRGWIEGRTLVVDCVATGTELERSPELARELIARHPDVLLGQGQTPAFALKRATAVIPIVSAAPDPLRAGIVENLAHPEGNVTGLAPMAIDLVVKRLQLLKQLLPRLTRVAVIRAQPYSEANKVGLEALKADLAAASQQLDFDWNFVNPGSVEEVDALFAQLRTDGSEAAYIWGTSFSYLNRQRIAELALQYRIPTLSDGMDMAKVGILLNYGWDLAALMEGAAEYIDRLLRGAKPADLPLRQPTKFELTINLKTARALGIEVPASIMVSATDVIE
jgi:putative ABC transport system substrate-binding protein